MSWIMSVKIGEKIINFEHTDTKEVMNEKVIKSLLEQNKSLAYWENLKELKAFCIDNPFNFFEKGKVRYNNQDQVKIDKVLELAQEMSSMNYSPLLALYEYWIWLTDGFAPHLLYTLNDLSNEEIDQLIKTGEAQGISSNLLKAMELCKTPEIM